MIVIIRRIYCFIGPHLGAELFVRLLLFLKHAVADMDGICRAGSAAPAAADALRRLGMGDGIDVHRTDARALSAMHALALVDR